MQPEGSLELWVWGRMKRSVKLTGTTRAALRLAVLVVSICRSLTCCLFSPCTVSCSPSPRGRGGLQKADLYSMPGVSAGRWVSGRGAAGQCPGCSVGIGAVSPWRAASVLTPHGCCCSIRRTHMPDSFGWEDSRCQGWRYAWRCF